MPSQNTSPDGWIGKLVWFFPRDGRGLPDSNCALCGIVIDQVADGVYVIMYKGERLYTWVSDMEIVEEWSEDLEGEDGSLETSGERTRGHDWDSLE